MSFTLFASRKSEINNAIASIQSQIALLQQQLADQQAFLQEIGTVEQAGESALNQARTFLSMVRAIDPSQEAVFWQSMDALKNQELDALAPGSEEPESDVAPCVTQPPEIDETPVETGTIEVTATPVDEDSSTTEPQGTVDVSYQATARSLHKQRAQPLQWLATKRGIDCKGMKRHEIASALTGLVTTAELDEAIAQVQNVS